MKLKGLDSIRFISFFLIFILHFYGFKRLGAEIVALFFTLSSFLLTYLMLKEIRESQKFSAFNFFIRRSLRIFPLYFLILLLSFLVLPVVAETINYTVKMPEKQWFYWLFISNYEKSDHLFALKFLWTLSVEEQFYLIFILISPLFKRFFFSAIVFLFLVYLLFYYFAESYQLQTFGMVFTYFPFFLSGMVAAYIFTKEKVGRNYMLCLFFLMLLFSFFIQQIEWLYLIGVAISYAFLILAIILFVQFYSFIQENWVFKLVEMLGQFTLGMYVFSGFVITFGNIIFPKLDRFLLFLIELLVIFGLSFMSYFLFEKKFLTLKKFFR